MDFMHQFLINILNGLSAGLLLFMLSAGLTLIFSMLGVLNFAHASFYMLGAYLAHAVSGVAGFWPALLLAPLAVGLMGALFERSVLRRDHRAGQAGQVGQAGHLPELLITFGLSYVVLEGVQLVWGRAALQFEPPALLQGSAFTLVQSPGAGLSLVLGTASEAVCQGARCARFPMTRAFMMGVALLMLTTLWLLSACTRIGLVIRASLSHPTAVQALGHDVPGVFTAVFGGGCALAALAGVIGGISFVTEPAMAGVLGSIIFVVVVVGGLGSLAGAFAASILIGLLQTLPLAVDASLADALNRLGASVGPATPGWPLLRITLAQAAPSLPYLLLVLVLAFRPWGLLGKRNG
jgi:branched-chain amino acid transport system permease protein